MKATPEIQISAFLANKPGVVAHLCSALADINIEYIYATAVPGMDVSLGVFRVSDHAAALALDFEPLTEVAEAG